MLETIDVLDATVEVIRKRLGATEGHPSQAIAPYGEFSAEGKTYHFTPGGFLYHKDLGTEVVGACSAATLPTRPGTTDVTMASRGCPTFHQQRIPKGKE